MGRRQATSLMEQVRRRKMTEQLTKTRMGSVEEKRLCTQCSTWPAVRLSSGLSTLMIELTM